MSRIGLGRHGNLDDNAGDPLDGLVNLFDVGIVLAVAFLIAGLGMTASARRATPSRQQAQQQRRLPSPSSAPPATGRGREVGTVYRLADGRLVYVEDPARAP
ncbi:DUF2149 domain-containing protein [Conexibacter woesei]|uniref:DUF2149 domain-containing protein n=1 Tax=Conexibacter woesei (strain DSM 14684 / CCUG 47730 / CIP 108061 / JCM 11494 / NBRC 100937 / ID131577) TaxID=469383 RepID=D3F175_CONWI|nr:DUF2149 domain-containing protein [Conexibacter woesei]ADB50151.1 Protein of unknown function DUF2149 [Conexibacter woesei DSM 14684]